MLFRSVIGVLITTFFWVRSERPEARPPDLVPIRLTANGSDSPVGSVAVSPDGAHLAYSDADGVHMNSLAGVGSRVLLNTRGMSVEYWSADGDQRFS